MIGITFVARVSEEKPIGSPCCMIPIFSKDWSNAKFAELPLLKNTA
jgi:hypothetical protein